MLVKPGIAAGINSEGAVRSHVPRVLEEGISPDELRHAVLLTVFNGRLSGNERGY